MKKLILIFAAGAFIYIGVVQIKNQKTNNPDDENIEVVVNNVFPPNSNTNNQLPVTETNTSNDKTDNNSVAPISPVELSKFPDNTYVLIVYKSFEDTTGIRGVPVGTIVVKQENSNKYKTADGIVLELQGNEVTNNVEIARRFIKNDQLVQSHLKKAPPATPIPKITNNNNNNSPVVDPPRGNTSISSGTLGKSHSRVKDGWYWEMKDGQWERVRPTR